MLLSIARFPLMPLQTRRQCDDLVQTYSFEAMHSHTQREEKTGASVNIARLPNACDVAAHNHRLRVRIYITLHCIFSGDFIGSICISFYRSLGVFCYFTVPAFYGFQRYTKCCMCVNSSQVVYNNIYRVMLFWGNYCVVSMTMVWCEEFCENCFRVDCLVLCFG